MEENISEIIASLKSKQTPSGKAFDENELNRILQSKLAEALSSPAIANVILQNLLKSKQDPNTMKLEQMIEKKDSASDDNLIPTKIESEIIDDLISGNNVYLRGIAGGGKTFMAKKISKILQSRKAIPEGKSYYLINCSQWTSPMDIIGGFNIKGYKQGAAVEAWSKGGVLILDELPKLDPNTAGLLNEMLASKNEKGATITDAQGVVHPVSPNFYVIGAGNTNMITVGEGYGGNNRQDYSLFDRFAGSTYLVEADIAKEQQLNYKVVFAISEGIRTFLLKSKGSEMSISIRTMLNFGRIYQLEMLRNLYQGKKIDGVAYGKNKEGKEVVLFNEPLEGEGKTLADSVNSFIGNMPQEQQIALAGHIIPPSAIMFEGETISTALGQIMNDESQRQFIDDYIGFYGIDPQTGKYVG
jgi:cobaltochelatase CobS